ncbi:unnamed protein product [Brachionus calyciflorus]|uniref:Mediator of RNA polymerase II transcription subunit 29 n=1 Tax=Brachionus calyciflorus TaxID=104777 RepID=A0A813PD20_9BILA|nr:unnamed protein product [Brachionus calyciflorus]
MNNQINSPAGYYPQGGVHPGQPTQQPMVNIQPNVIPPNPVMTNPVMMPNPAPVPDHFHTDSDIVNDGLVDPIVKSKDLLKQLKMSLQALLEQLVIVFNPPNESSQIQTENQYQLLGKHIENFNRACDLLTVNLRVACEAQTISNELKQFSRYYAHMGPMDANRNENPYINSINIQMQRISEFRNMIQNYLAPRQTSHTEMTS